MFVIVTQRNLHFPKSLQNNDNELIGTSILLQSDVLVQRALGSTNKQPVMAEGKNLTYVVTEMCHLK